VPDQRKWKGTITERGALNVEYFTYLLIRIDVLWLLKFCKFLKFLAVVVGVDNTADVLGRAPAAGSELGVGSGFSSTRFFSNNAFFDIF